MRRVADLNTAPTREELIRPPQSIPIQRSKELGSRVTVEVWQSEGVGCNVPARSEPEEVG